MSKFDKKLILDMVKGPSKKWSKKQTIKKEVLAGVKKLRTSELRHKEYIDKFEARSDNLFAEMSQELFESATNFLY